jgi:hypothetical protein
MEYDQPVANKVFIGGTMLVGTKAVIDLPPYEALTAKNPVHVELRAVVAGRIRVSKRIEIFIHASGDVKGQEKALLEEKEDREKSKDEKNEVLQEETFFKECMEDAKGGKLSKAQSAKCIENKRKKLATYEAKEKEKLDDDLCLSEEKMGLIKEKKDEGKTNGERQKAEGKSKDKEGKAKEESTDEKNTESKNSKEDEDHEKANNHTEKEHILRQLSDRLEFV